MNTGSATCEMNIMKVSSSGNMLWGWVLGGSNTDIVTSISTIGTTTELVVVSGYSSSGTPYAVTSGNGPYISIHLSSTGVMVNYYSLYTGTTNYLT